MGTADRQCDFKRTSFPVRIVVHRNLTMMQSDKLLREVQPYPASWNIVIGRIVSLIEALENLIHLVGFYRQAIVPDFHRHLTSTLLQPDTDIPFGRREFKCVGQKIHDYLIKVLFIQPYFYVICIVFKMKVDFFFACFTVEEFINISCKIYQIHRLHLHHHLSFIYFTQIQNLIDKS